MADRTDWPAHTRIVQPRPLPLLSLICSGFSGTAYTLQICPPWRSRSANKPRRMRRRCCQGLVSFLSKVRHDVNKLFGAVSGGPPLYESAIFFAMIFRRIFLFCTLVAVSLPGQEAKQSFKIQPLRPVREIRAEAVKAQPPVEQGDFRKPDLVELIKLDSTLKLDIHYASDNNFLGTPLYTEARAFLQRQAASPGLRLADLRWIPTVVRHEDLLGSDASHTAFLRGRSRSRLTPQPRMRR